MTNVKRKHVPLADLSLSSRGARQNATWRYDATMTDDPTIDDLIAANFGDVIS